MTFSRLAAIVLIALAAPSLCRADAPASPASTRAAFLKLIDRPRVDPAPQEHQEPLGDLTLIHFNYDSEAAQRVPGILIKSFAASGKRPAVIVCHGTGGKKENETNFLKRLATHGFIGVAIDGRYHGERGTQAEYNAAIARAFEKNTDGVIGEHPLYYDTAWDLMRLIDYLSTRADVDASRVALMGISKGGIETWLTAAADERIACAIPCISVQDFEWGLENDGWHGRVGTVKKAFDAAAKSDGVTTPDAAFVRKFYDRVLPGIHDRFDCPAMLTAIAPRPLLIINGDKDPLNPLPGVTLAADAARAAYHAANADDHFKQIVEPNTAHNVTPDAYDAPVDWLVRWLKPASAAAK